MKLIISYCIIFYALGFNIGLSQDQFKTIIPGIGFDNIEIGKTTFNEIIEKYGNSYIIDTVYLKTDEHDEKKEIEIYSIKISYDSIGILLSRFPCNDEIFSINLKFPFKGKTSNGIVLNHSTFKEVEIAYGKTDWAFVKFNSILKMYDGIHFYMYSEDEFPLLHEKDENLQNQKVLEISIQSNKRKINRRKKCH